MIRTLLVEDHELERLGLSIMLEQAENIELVGQAENGIKGVELAKSLLPDVIIMEEIILMIYLKHSNQVQMDT